MSIVITVCLTFVFSVLKTSLAEWCLHKYFMHTRVRWFIYPFRAHTLVHHHEYKADASYHWRDQRRDLIPMAWWNGAVIVLIVMIPFGIIATLTGQFVGSAEGWAMLATDLCVSAGYYGIYEGLHWCMHVPRARWIERTRIFRVINALHLLHHKYMGYNFNVVLPFADWLFGTLLVRAKRSFNQACGEAVPNVQPN